jgi:CRISPR-associated protein Csx17
MSESRAMSSEPLHLLGCAPTPLAHYLKALGVLRLVAEQADPDAKGYWEAEHFVLESLLDREGLIDFFVRFYRPTPILTPWNNGSGFYYREGKTKQKDPKTGKLIKTGIRDAPTEATRIVEALAKSTDPRLKSYRDAIAATRRLLHELHLEEAPSGAEKVALIIRLRSRFSDGALPWLDAAVALSSTGAMFPPLLGSGGNDGNLDFASNFMQRFVELFDPDSRESHTLAAAWLRASIYAKPASGLVQAAIGQFAPGMAGGPNATTGFEAEKLPVNPWDFVLMLEGALLFAAAATRRLRTGGEAALSYPFTVQPTGGGSSAAALSDEKPTRAEIWLPLWERPSSCPEIRALFAEGRATLGRRSVRDGLDFARSVGRLGVDRGICAFQRYAFQRRAGKNHIATPLSRIAVRRNPMADLIDQLDRADWLGRFRRLARHDNAPARLGALGRRLDGALFDLAAHGTAAQVQAVLIVLGEVVTYAAHSPAAREMLQPLRLLDPNWLEAADDGSAEFHIAAALASLGAGGGDLPMRLHFAPVDDEGSGWSELARLFVWGVGSLADNLVAVLCRRLIEADRRQLPDKPFGGTIRADLTDVMAFLAATTDDARMAGLLAGLVHVRPFARLAPRWLDPPNVPLSYAVLKPLFAPRSILVELGALPPDAALPIPSGLLGRLLDRGEIGIKDATEMAARRVRASGVSLPIQPGSVPRMDGRRLAAALLIPIGTRGMRQLLDRAYPNALANVVAPAAAQGE